MTAIKLAETSFVKALPFALKDNSLLVGSLDHIYVVAALLKSRALAMLANNANDLSEILNQILLNPNIGDPRSGGSVNFWGGVKELAQDAFNQWIGELNSEDFRFSLIIKLWVVMMRNVLNFGKII